MKLERYNLFILVLTAWVAFATGNLYGQSQNGRALTRGEESPSLMRVDSDPADVPCAGVTILEEEFIPSLPTGWTMVDGDGLTPRTETGLVPGWQIITDYRDTSNTLMVSPSWYDNGGGVSNDWLISPQITLADNPCLSWTAYSQDGGFPEGYEVYLSTTGNDTSDFLAGNRIDTVPAELDDYTIRALSLVDFANQTVHIAFRQISDDKFVLALDKIRVSNIVPVDIGVSSVVYGNPSPGDSLEFSIGVANYGSETVTNFDLCYAIDGGTPSCMSVDTFILEPNQVIAITHDTKFLSDTLDEFYTFCAWTLDPNNGGDNNANNDTLCEEIAVGNPVGILSANLDQLELIAYPNPTSGMINLDLQGNRDGIEISIVGIDGRLHLEEKYRGGQERIEIDLRGLPKGIYLLLARSDKGKTGTARLILE